MPAKSFRAVGVAQWYSACLARTNPQFPFPAPQKIILGGICFVVETGPIFWQPLS